jgi:quinohemoprotein ethanol dehydrogenase
VFPGAQGGHNWQPISFSPRTGLLYFSETTLPHLHINDPSARFEPKRKRWNLGQIVHSSEDPKEIAQLVSMIGGSLMAWDPVAQKQAWKVPQKVVFNGGTLATAGNLVFHGSSEGQLVAYAADRGSKLWSFDARTGVLAGPVTYTVGKDQYVAVAAGGPGGAFGMVFGDLAKAAGVDTIGRVLIFKLDGKATLPPAPKKSASKLEPPPQTATAATIDNGRALYNQQCVFCHGLNAASGASFVPDLRYMSKATHDVFIGIVLGGLKQNTGMPIFVDQLSIEDTEAIRAYVIMRAHEAKAVALKQ